MEILKISSKSNVNSVAGALTAQIKEFGKSEMQAVGNKFSMYSSIYRSRN